MVTRVYPLSKTYQSVYLKSVYFAVCNYMSFEKLNRCLYHKTSESFYHAIAHYVHIQKVDIAPYLSSFFKSVLT